MNRFDQNDQRFLASETDLGPLGFEIMTTTLCPPSGGAEAGFEAGGKRVFRREDQVEGTSASQAQKPIPYTSSPPWQTEVGYQPLYVRSGFASEETERNNSRPQEQGRASMLRSASGVEWRKKHEAHIAAARMIQRFNARDAGVLRVEKQSVYGAALTMPQLARSAGWPKFLTSLALRSYFFLFTNYCMQGMLLSLVQKEENVMDLFSGKVYLCDFGAYPAKCSGDDDPSCRGPGGTHLTPGRLYDFQTWKLRNFVRDSMLAAFPDQASDIMDKVDPGEYGVESHMCRCLCCLIFMMSCWNELDLIYQLCHLLYKVPAKDEPWIELKERKERSGDDEEDEPQGPSDYMNHMRFKVAGMPTIWKLINIAVVLTPKALLWKITAEAGVMFLMETSGIEDIIVNSVALAFVLNIDEMMCQTLMSQVTKDILENLEDMPLYQLSEREENLSDDEVMERHNKEHSHYFHPRDLALFVPWKLVFVLLLTSVCMYEYYVRNCQRASAGTWVSKDMFLPMNTDFGFLNAFFPNFFRVRAVDDPYWSLEKSGIMDGSHES